MSYQVLARKWRPRSFETLVGQEHVVRALTHALDQQRLHHAYLFTGTRGVGKTTIARILAKALNCEIGITSKPCGACSSCQEIDAGRFVDLIEVDAATNTKVDEMRQLLENAAYAPTRGRFKVYVIDEVHMLSTSAFNAMLKTLEEPPEHIKFILATTDPQKIPVTVLSRCLQFNLKQMPQGHIVDHLARILEAEQVPFEPAALRHIAKGAAGSMRDALSLLDQAIAHGAGRVEEAGVRDMLGTVGEDHLFALLDALAARDVQAALAVAAEMDARSLSFDSALQELATLFHRIALVQMAPGAIADDAERTRLAACAQRLDAEFLQLCYQIAINGRSDLALAPDEYSGFLMTLMRLLAFNPETPSALAIGPPSEPVAHVPAAAAPAAVPSAAPARTAAAPADVGGWHGLLERLKLGGMVRELAHHCELAAQEEGAITLRLNPAHKSLLINKQSQDKLQAALTTHFGRPVRLSIEVGEINGETPAQRAELARTEKHNRAIESLEQDPFVRGMIETFDATINEQSIKPL
ncbi:MAG: Holliday junction ATP-dependent DNA helicase RuvB [Rhodocyclaceae bacterium]|nr:MAG: DNA polymerase III subunit gamma/tau [Rhodocyclaceae bacterium]MBE7421575.1 DNA polymerase III subunit gamma/tau [Zoogloeaceae bacterium]MBV6408755.1 Holliday junction ATP-dependent DNA helicase RuvB [Rhodocyclaceae bacterium]MCK6385452.1 DNA polymerase III subunit gamma/tau [Rhodocyclaceae bacterium]CAG0932680.1 DNA polymerase III subunit gamma/tau [Rhodocyclaceae bacterium]